MESDSELSESFVISPPKTTFSNDPKRTMERLGFFDYYQESNVLAAFKNWIEGTMNDQEAAIKKVNGFIRVVSNQNPRAMQSKLSLEHFLHVDNIRYVFRMMNADIPELSANTSRKYCTMLMKFIEFLETSDDCFPIFNIPVLTKNTKSTLAVVKRIIMNWKKRFAKEARKAQIRREYNFAVQPMNAFNLQLAQSTFESAEFRNQIERIEAFVERQEFSQQAATVKITSLNSDSTMQEHFEFLVQTLASYRIPTNNSPLKIITHLQRH